MCNVHDIVLRSVVDLVPFNFLEVRVKVARGGAIHGFIAATFPFFILLKLSLFGVVSLACFAMMLGMEVSLFVLLMLTCLVSLELSSYTLHVSRDVGFLFVIFILMSGR